MLNRIFRTKRAALSRQTLVLDASKPVAVAGNHDGKLQISGTDKNSGRPFILVLPADRWPAVARAMGGHLAFLELQQRRENEHAIKGSGLETLKQELLAEFRGWCEGHGFNHPMDTPDTIQAHRTLTKEHYEFLDNWRKRWNQAFGQKVAAI